MGFFRSELRPAYCQEATYAATITIEGTGSIAGWTFTASLTDPSGNAIVAGATAVVADAAARTVTLTLQGQAAAGDYRWDVRRTDDSSDSVVALGIIEITNPLM